VVPVSLYFPHLQVVSPQTSFSENVRNATIIIYCDLFVSSWSVINFWSHKRRSEALRMGNRCLLLITIVAAIAVKQRCKKLAIYTGTKMPLDGRMTTYFLTLQKEEIIDRKT